MATNTHHTSVEECKARNIEEGVHQHWCEDTLLPKFYFLVFWAYEGTVPPQSKRAYRYINGSGWYHCACDAKGHPLPDAIKYGPHHSSTEALQETL
jgi:hypothetical protein